MLNLFLFNKKKLQIFFNKINILTNSIHLLIFLLSLYQLNRYTLIILIFFILCIYFLYLTNKAIKKDIELIDSISRIR
ncbi:DUF4293 family protein [Blattabacterium cuenoti]|uniref:DUF4293 family protein n=1 Tax=Blattabacterium cuenoti TaxID=1653831 RepID=UPI001EE9D3C6|nr:DUF4293 family protein [Blattabacterium cuenoti]